MADIFTIMFWTGIGVAADLLIMFIPLKILGMLTVPFSMKTFGIRKVRRWHSRTDTLGNLMIWISVIFCIASPWIPWSPVIYLVWLTFTWLAALARAVRLSQVKESWQKRSVIFLINLWYLAGILSGSGFCTHYSVWNRAMNFAIDLENRTAIEFLYPFSSMQPASYLLLVVTLLLPLAVLWGQFKYMRLENTFKARNISGYIVKNVLGILILFGAGCFGMRALEAVYQASPEDRQADDNARLPMSLEELRSWQNAIRVPEQDPVQTPQEQISQHPQAPQETPPETEQPAIPEENVQENPNPGIYYDEYGNAYDAAGNLIEQ